MNIRASDIARFRKKVDQGHPLKCWEWRGTRGTRGYGQFKWYDIERGKFRTIGAHRFALYLAMNTVLPSDVFSNHLCMNRNCVNPSHLRAVDIATSNTENCATVPAINKKKTHCKRGHSFSGDNLGITKTWRYCKTCVRNYGVMRRSKIDLERGPGGEKV